MDKTKYLISLMFFTLIAADVGAQTYASQERSAIAIGHYARARALLVEALAEFEAGKRIAQPNLLLDPDEWRLNIVSRTEELNRLLDPQPRVTRSGVQYKADRRLIRRQRSAESAASDDPQASSTHGEEQRRAQRAAQAQASRARQAEPVQQPVFAAKAREREEQRSKQLQMLLEETAAAEEQEATQMAKPAMDEVADAADSATEDSDELGEAEVPEVDEEVSQAIEEAIQARLNKINGDNN